MKPRMIGLPGKATKPKPLSDFKRWRGAGKWATLERLERPPQSWCYVDGGLIG